MSVSFTGTLGRKKKVITKGEKRGLPEYPSATCGGVAIRVLLIFLLRVPS